MKYFIFLACIFVSAIFLSCGSSGKDSNTKKVNAPVAVDVMIAAEEEVSNKIEANGTVISEDMVEFHAEISGRITMLNFPDGALVSAGTVLARINDADLQAELKQLKVELDLATKTEQRYIKLLAVNGIDQATYDAALSAVDNLNARIDVKKAQLDKTSSGRPLADDWDCDR
jgi:membrane fusion protein (multidrug efflux system)